MRTLTRGPNSVRFKGSCFYPEKNHSLIELCSDKQEKAFTVNLRPRRHLFITDTPLIRTAAESAAKISDWKKLPLSQTFAITDLQTPLSVPTAQFYCSCSRYNGHQSTSCGNILVELSQIIIYFFLFLCSSLSLWLKSEHPYSCLTWYF